MAALLAAVSLAILPGWSAWICVGMESALAAFFVAAAFFAALRGRASLTGILIAAAALSRPESAVLVPALLLALPRRQWPRLLAFALLPMAAVVLARHAWFGEWVPNTYIAKRHGLGLAGPIRGLRYVAAFAAAYLLLVVAIARGLFRHGPSRVFALACVTFTAAVAWDGGDHFPLSRLFCPALPIACALFGAELAALPRRVLPLVVSLGLLSSLWLPRALGADSLAQQLRDLRDASEFTRQLQEAVPMLATLPPGTIATLPIGVFSFATGRRVLDLVGLADAHIARTPHLAGVMPGHDHADVDYVLQRRPEIALLMPLPTSAPMTVSGEADWLTAHDRYYRSPRLLQADPRFREAYEPYDVPGANGRYLHLWRLRR